MPNRLADQLSPYLLQHKDNPVDWYPWCDEALVASREADKPIFLSIGYSACHWCHVMEHESFENEEIALLMNDKFINVKVDREERPDLDSIYMAAVQTLTGRGGWPMSVFLTPDCRPFYAGTYYPPEDRHGMPGFKKVLHAVSDAYSDKKDQIIKASEHIFERIQGHNRPSQSNKSTGRDFFESGFDSLIPSFDYENGGFGPAPKFPQPMLYEYALHVWASTGNRDALESVTTTLTRMAKGGIHDQLGGGFHRYSVDGVWLVPHFEKMLYDNAQLALLYLHAWQATGDPLFRATAVKTFDYVEREMCNSKGGFYSSQDADSEGVEGKYFVWDAKEINLELGSRLGRIATSYWGVSKTGNFEGVNILWAPRTDDEVAMELNIEVDQLLRQVNEASTKLFNRRSNRVKPGLDDKIIVSWNALMQKAFAEASTILADDHYLDVAKSNAEFLLKHLMFDGRLLRMWKDSEAGGTARLNGYLEDYAMLADGLLSLYEATFEEGWLVESQKLARAMITLFWDESDGVFYDTGSDHEKLLVRPRDIFDNAQPSGSSTATMFLFKIAALTGETEFRRIASLSMLSVANILEQAPSGLANWLIALDFSTSSLVEIALVGPRNHPTTQEFIKTVSTRYIPNRIFAGCRTGCEKPISPLLVGKDLIDRKPVAYVCKDYVCNLPALTADSLAAQLVNGDNALS